MKDEISTDNTSLEKTWTINVPTTIGEFIPDTTEITAYPLDSLFFEVIPTNPESDSLSILFRSDGFDRSTRSKFGLFFRRLGLHTVQARVTDGALIDSITWNITIIEPNQSDDHEFLPVSTGIDKYYPNPFNSLINIRYAVSSHDRILLQILDLNGRIVETLVDDEMQAGYHNAVWQADNRPAGVYLCRFQSEEKAEVVKILLMK
jgi:hypothetical protein